MLQLNRRAWWHHQLVSSEPAPRPRCGGSGDRLERYPTAPNGDRVGIISPLIGENLVARVLFYTYLVSTLD